VLARKVVLISGDEYTDCAINQVKEGFFPNVIDSMVELSFRKKRIYINTAMIVSIELFSNGDYLKIEKARGINKP